MKDVRFLIIFVFCKNYVFAWTCKNTNPKANPKSVIPQQIKAVVKISPIFSSLKIYLMSFFVKIIDEFSFNFLRCLFKY